MAEEFPRPTRSLVGRVAIVSGAGAAGDGIGNGRASAILLAEAGANVVCVDMALDLAQKTADLIEKDGHSKSMLVLESLSHVTKPVPLLQGNKPVPGR